jgi:F-type H+-transporting ATPase subunit epsilon
VAEQTITLRLCAPERAPRECAAAEVIVPGEDGIFTVLPGHTPLLSTLTAGVVTVYSGDEESAPTFFVVSGGFVDVKDNIVSILADVFEEGQEIDFKRAEAAQERAETRLLRPEDDTDLARAEMALQRSLARLQAQESNKSI